MGKTSDTDVYVKRPKTSAQVSQTLKGKHTLSLNISIACCTGGELQDLLSSVNYLKLQMFISHT